MSTLKVDGIRSNSASSDAITLASDGTCTANITNNLSNRNLIINGAMQVAQRGDATGVTNAYGGCDRYKYYSTGATVNLTQATGNTSAGFAKAQRIDVTTADTSLASSDRSYLTYRIEGQDLQRVKKGTSSAEQLTMSFWIKSTVTGTYILELWDEDNTRTCSKSYTVSSSNTWEKKEITFPADTTGAWDNDNGESLLILFWLNAGSNYTSGTLNTSWAGQTNANRAVGQVNALNSTSNDIYFTGIQLEVGSVATDFEHKRFDDELFACQRYYCELFKRQSGESQYSFIGLQAYTTQHIFGTLGFFPRKMRSLPTITVVGTLLFSNKSGGNIYEYNSGTMGNAVTRETVGTHGVGFDTAHFIQGGFACGFTNNDGSDYIKADAEL